MARSHLQHAMVAVNRQLENLAADQLIAIGELEENDDGHQSPNIDLDIQRAFAASIQAVAVELSHIATRLKANL